MKVKFNIEVATIKVPDITGQQVGPVAEGVKMNMEFEVAPDEMAAYAQIAAEQTKALIASFAGK